MPSAGSQNRTGISTTALDHGKTQPHARLRASVLSAASLPDGVSLGACTGASTPTLPTLFTRGLYPWGAFPLAACDAPRRQR